mgnify:CR=1 FL=1
MNEQEKKDYVGYEYKEVTVRLEEASFYQDCYENFGWKPDGNFTMARGSHWTTLRLKRDRKIINKMELTRLQRNMEACVASIDELERSVTSGARLYAVLLGLVGTAFLAMATFAVVAPEPRILLCVILAIPGFAGWILPLFVYKWIRRKRRERTMPLIEEKYDEIYAICEKGQKLLY